MLRFFDIILCGLALLICSPLFLIMICILRFTGEGEIFYLQDRIGRGGKVFRLIKFATMLKDSPNIGTGTITMQNDSRVLPVGKFLRKTKINELPQLFNVLLGDMSVIGPRPLTIQNFKCYAVSTQKTIGLVRPGLSGVGSIIFRHEEEIMHGAAASVDFYKDVIAPYKGSLEEWFVENKSVNLYFLAIFLTIYVIFIPKTGLVWKVLRDLPLPPIELKNAVYFS